MTPSMPGSFHLRSPGTLRLMSDDKEKYLAAIWSYEDDDEQEPRDSIPLLIAQILGSGFLAVVLVVYVVVGG
jgi:hypothetical protein